MRRMDRQITDDDEIDQVICKSKVCRLGLNDNGDVYIVPMNFGYVHNGNRRVFYFHSAPCGRKVELLKACPAASFELDVDFSLIESDVACGYSAAYACVMGRGNIHQLTDRDLKIKALERLMSTMTGREGWIFNNASVDRVAVFSLEVEDLSCKIHRLS